MMAGIPLKVVPEECVRFFASTTSTNDEALAWAENGAEDFSIVAADSQTHGRGRFGRQWITQPGSALAVSVILRPAPREMEFLSLFSGLAGLAVCDALEVYHLRPEIKWPNDVLLEKRKVAGILLENQWQGSRLTTVVMGIGVNIKRDAAPPDELVQFPAASVEGVLGAQVDRWEFLDQMLSALKRWRTLLGSPELIRVWEDRLAFREEWVRIGTGLDSPRLARLLGLGSDGSLRLVSPEGEHFSVQVGEISLRPAQDH